MAYNLPDLEDDFIKVGEALGMIVESLEFLKDNQDSVGQASIVELLDAAGYFDAVNVEDALTEMVEKLLEHSEDEDLHPTEPDQVGAAPISHVGQGSTAAHPVASANGAAGFMSGLDKAKLDQLGFEAGSMTAAEILTALKTVDGSTSGLDADLLDGVEGSNYLTSAHAAAGGSSHPAATAGTAGFMSATDKAKLNGIGAEAALQDAAEVDLQDVGNHFEADNVEDALNEEATARKNHALSGGAVHPAVTTTVNGFMLATDKVKLNSVETNAKDNQTPTEILDAIKTVDGTGSGLDADLLDGNNASAFALAAHTHPTYYKFSRTGSAASPITGSTYEIVMEARTLNSIRVTFATAPTVSTTITLVRRIANGSTDTIGTVTVAANARDGVTTGLSVALAEGDAIRADVTGGGTSGVGLTVVAKAA